MRLDKIPIGENPPWDVNVLIEIPVGGQPVKYEIEKESGAMFVDRLVHTAMFYPCNYGFIPHTLSEDGDPVDVMVIAPTPIVVGAVMRSRPIGVLFMTDESGPDEKVLAVPHDKLHPYYQGVSSYRDIPEILHRALMRIFQPREAMVFVRRRVTSDQPERSSQLILTAVESDAALEHRQVVEIGEGPIGRLAERRRPGRGADVAADGEEPAFDLGAPMVHGDDVLGVITLTDLARQRSFDADLLWLLASLGAFALKSHLKLSQVRTIAELDPLTQVYNRSALSLRLAQEILKAESDGGPVSVLLFDVDDFKAYNERNGHLAGDSGQQFLIILPARSAAEAETAAENIRGAIARRSFLFGERQPKGRITISGGIASAPADAAGSTELLEAAAVALAAAKRGGRNKVISKRDADVAEIASVG